MNSGVRKSGWPMPRLIMSRPWAMSALARANTAKAFSSPIRSKAAMVLSILAFPQAFLSLSAAQFAGSRRPASTGLPLVPTDLNVGQFHHLEDDGDRPADQQQAVERRDGT